MELAHVGGGRSRPPTARATLVHFGRWIWRALEAHGRNRAAQALLELPDRREATAPDVARQMRAACRSIPERKPRGQHAGQRELPGDGM